MSRIPDTPTRIGRKNILKVLVLQVFLAAAPVLAAVEFQLKLSGGLSFLSPDAVNLALRDWPEWKRLDADSRQVWTYLDAKTPRISRGVAFEGEFLLYLSPRIALSIGSGFMYSALQPEDTVVRIDKPLGETWEIQPRTLSAVPLTVSAYYHIPLHRRSSFYLRAGGGWAWGRYVEREGSRRITAEKYGYSREENSSAAGPVYLCGLGLDFILEPGVRFFLEGSFRRIKLSGYSGAMEGDAMGTLYSFEEFLPEFEFWQAKNRLLLQPPAGENTRNVRETEVDFSGFSLMIGVAIRF